eukprot:s2059_g7.t1
MTDAGAEIKMAITLVSGVEVHLPYPSFEGEKVQQLRLRLAEQLKVPSGQVALLCGVDLLRDMQTLGSLPRNSDVCEVTLMVSKKWDEKLQDLLVNPGWFTSAGIASQVDGLVFACSEGGEARLQMPEYTQVSAEISEEMPIKEAEILKFTIEKGHAPETGMLRHDLDDEPYTTLVAVSTKWNRDGVGMVAISTGANILLCRFDEPGENLYSILGCMRKNAAAFADLMKNEGM